MDLRNSLLSMAIFLAFFGPGFDAFATGLVIVDADADPIRLATLTDLSVSVTLDDDSADVVETRTYAVQRYEAERAVRFVRTMNESVDVESYRVFVDDLPVSVRHLRGGEATTAHTDLLTAMREPGMARGWGLDLSETGAIYLGEDPWRTVTVRVEYTASLVPWDTLRAVRLPIDWQEHAVNSVSVDVVADVEEPLKALYSPYHALQTVRTEGGAVASYSGREVCTTNDLVLMLSTGDEDVRLDLLPFRYGDEEGGFFMALLTPGASSETMPRDLVFVIDTSGSMEGEKMEQARDALHGVLEGLSPKDRFTVVEFDSNVKVLSGDAQPASSAFLSQADEFVANLVADGATNLSEALETGFDALPFAQDRPRYVVVLTDGQPTEGATDTDEILEIVRLRNEVGARVFAFGIGNDVNTILLDRLAQDSSGDAIYIRPGESVVGPVQSFFAQIASAALVDPVFDSSDFGGFSLVYPERLPDLYTNQTVAVVGRYDAGGRGEITLSGTRGSDRTTTRYDVELPETSDRNGHVPRVWATRHVGTLLHEIKLGNDDPNLPLEATAVAARFGVVTEFTNFVLDEDGNAVMTYTNVPLDATGSVAVDTSASLDGYQNTGSAGMRFDEFVRYAADRTLPTVDGWYRDTSLAASPAWVDVRFASPLYFELLASQSRFGIGKLLGVARDVSFDWHGSALRVSDPSEDREVPAEAADLPAVKVPESTPASVEIMAEDRVAHDANDRDTGGIDEPGTSSHDGDGTEDPYESGSCASASGAAQPSWLVLLLALFAASRRRRSRCS